MGICTLTFVHYKHQQTWLIETFHLSYEEHSSIKYDENQAEVIQNQLEYVSHQTFVFEVIIYDIIFSQKKLIRVKVAPWTQINGTINHQTLNTWLSSVLSYCLEFPHIQFFKLCEKFCYLKPVDVYTLLEVFLFLC